MMNGRLSNQGDHSLTEHVHIPDEADQRSGVMSITIPG
jgi:hypothetical protein